MLVEQEIERLQQLLGSDRDPSSRCFVPLADAYRRSEALDDALTVLEEGLARHPDFASAHIVAGWVHLDRGEPDLAIGSFESALALDPENVAALRGMADAFEAQSAYREAAEHLQQLNDLERQAPEVLRRIEELEALGTPGVPRGYGDTPSEPEEREDEWQAYPPPDPFAEVGMASAAWPVPDSGVGDDEGIEESWEGKALSEAALDEEPEELSLEPVGEPPEAAETHRDEAAGPEAVAWSVDDGEVYTETMAELYADQELYARAVDVYRHLVDSDPGNDRYRERLQELEQALAGHAGLVESVHEVEFADPSWVRMGAEQPHVSTPFAWTEEEVGEAEVGEEGSPRPVSAYFDDLLAWVPGAIPISALAPGDGTETVAEEVAPPAAAEVEEEGEVEAPPQEEEDTRPGAVDESFEAWLRRFQP